MAPALALVAVCLAGCGGGGGDGPSSTEAETRAVTADGPAPSTAAPATTARSDPSTLPLDDPATLQVGPVTVTVGQHDWSYVRTDGAVAAQAAAARQPCGDTGQRVAAGAATLRVPLPAASIRVYENPTASSAEQTPLGSANGPELTFELPARRVDLAVAAFGDGFSNNYHVCLDARPAQAPTGTASPASTER